MHEPNVSAHAEVNDLRQRAVQARKAGDIALALSGFETLWLNHDTARTAWDGWGYAWCLYKQQKYKSALERALEARALDPDLENLKSLQAWCLYHLNIKPDPPVADFDDAVDQIMALCSETDTYSPRLRTLFRAVEVAKSPEEQLRLLGFVDADTLSREPQHFQDGAKTRQLPSDWLRYWAKWSEALFQLKAYEACLECCQELLAQPELKGMQKIWFQRRLARCHFMLAQSEQALNLYQEILKRKQDWFLKKEMAEVLRQADQAEQALQWAIDAALAVGAPDKKIHLYLLLAELLAPSQPQLALQHRQLVVAIREAHQWSIPTELQPLLDQELPSLSQLLADLESFWKQSQGSPSVAEASEAFVGQILNLLPHGKAGFLRSEVSKKNIYFETRTFRGEAAELQPGVHVTFELVEGFDQKKRRPSQKAINLRRYRAEKTSETEKLF